MTAARTNLGSTIAPFKKGTPNDCWCWQQGRDFSRKAEGCESFEVFQRQDAPRTEREPPEGLSFTQYRRGHNLYGAATMT